MTVAFSGRTLTIDARSIEMPWPVLSAVENAGTVFVLLDPDAYLLDPTYTASREAGVPVMGNLLALNRAGEQLWKADFPEVLDYYYKITSTEPLTALSFSSYRCELNRSNGSIVRKEFLK